MDFAFGKRIRRITALCLILLWIPFLLMGCYNITYPFEISARWVSDDPVFVIEYWAPPAIETDEYNAYLEADGTRIYVLVYYQADGYIVFPVDPITHEYDPHSEKLFWGTWKIKKNTMIFQVDDDTVWGGAYKEIRFTREELPPETVAVNP